MGTRDAGATKARILAAAISEFAERGHAGARVDSIARAAESNVRMIYAYFDSKSGLFDAAVTAAVERMAESVPVRPDALAVWAGELFDFHDRDPAVLRVCLWAQLERPTAVAEPLAAYAAKARAVTGSVGGPFTPVDALAIIYAIAQAWEMAPAGLLAEDRPGMDDDARTRGRRASAVAAVERLFGA